MGMIEKANTIPEIFQRTAMIYGPEAMEKLSHAKVIVFGVGGVGSWCAEGLARCGIGSLTLIDADTVCATNVNRQLQADSHNIGKPKVTELAERLRTINPAATVTALQIFYDHNTADSFRLAQYDCVVDAIDSIANKVLLLENCVQSNVAVVSSMGAACKRDPSKIQMSSIGKTHNCPLARIVRRELKRKQLNLDIPCVFSDEPPANSQNERGDIVSETAAIHPKKINGALVQITAIFGFMLSHLAIEALLRDRDAQ